MADIEDLKNSVINIQKEFKNKFRLPIIITYSVLLLIYNWDILFYLTLEKGNALSKIKYVKANFFTTDYHRIWIPILFAVLYSILFPFLQAIINQVVQYFKRYNNKITRQEELDNANHRFNIQQQLSGKQSLEQLQNKIDQLLLENEKLINTNNSLINQLKKESEDVLDTNHIFNSEYEKTAKEVFALVNKLNNEEKSAFIDVLTAFKENIKAMKLVDLEPKTIFPKHVNKALEILRKQNIIDQPFPGSPEYFRVNAFGTKFIKYFKENYVK